MRKIISMSVYVLIVSLTIGNVNAQNAYVPDTAFRAFLNANYPTVMDVSGDSIIKANAALETGWIYCGSTNIVDLTGIEWFINIVDLNCMNSQVSYIPPLSFLTRLKGFSCSNNNLSSLPFLPDSVVNLNCSSNNLTSFPNLSNLTLLENIYCGGNQFDTLPDLSSHPLLNFLDCGNNQTMSSLSDISSLISLEHLACYGCQLSALPDLSSFTLLQVLDCNNNNLTALPSLSALDSLKTLNCRRNLLTTLPDLSNNLVLESFQVSWNKLTSIPDLSDRPLKEVGLSNNELDFSDAREIRMIDTISSLTSAGYFPNGGFPLSETFLAVYIGDTITVSTASQDSATSYEWYVSGMGSFPGTDTAFTIVLDSSVIPGGSMYGDTIGLLSCISWGSALESPPLIWDFIDGFNSLGVKAIIMEDTTAPIDTTNAISDLLNVVEKNTIEIFPNPNDGNFRAKVYCNGQTHLSYSIYNLSGQIVFRDTFAPKLGEAMQSIQLDLEGLAKGLYQFKLDDGSAAQSFLIE